MVNNSKLTRAIFLISILMLSAVAIGTFDEIYARHTDNNGFSQDLVNGTNQLNFRDVTNNSPQVQGPTEPIPPLTIPFVTPNTSVIVSLTELDSNLNANEIDEIFANITSTTQPEGVVFQLDETAVNSAVFEGEMFISNGFEPGKLRGFQGDEVEVFYEPQHLGVGRLSATLINATDGRAAQLQDFTIDDPDGFNTRVVQACPYDLVIHPVEILIPIIAIYGPNPLAEAADAINVTISYANAVDVGPGEKYQVGDLELIYRTGTDIGISGFAQVNQSSPLVIDTTAKTLSSTLKKGEVFPVLSGQYAIGVDIAGCAGGGGGGLVRPGLVVNALAGFSSSASGGGGGPP